MTDTTPTSARYFCEIKWPGKLPLYAGTFTFDHMPPDYDEALIEAKKRIEKFTADHFPDGIAPPEVVEVKLGHLSMYVDDYEWRRGA